MEDQNLELKKYILQYGALLGSISVVFGLMLFSMDMHYQNETSTTVVSLVLTMGVIAFAQYSYRKDNEDFMSFSRALKLGVGIGLISAIIYSLFFIVLALVLDPNTISKSNEVAIEKMSEWSFVTDEILETTETEMENTTKSIAIFNACSQLIIGSIIIGFVISLITGLILKRNRPE
jgi:hypothetical protein